MNGLAQFLYHHGSGIDQFLYRHGIGQFHGGKGIDQFLNHNDKGIDQFLKRTGKFHKLLIVISFHRYYRNEEWIDFVVKMLNSKS